ncbi:Putative mediator of RNA polymerase II transcription subunit 22 [Triticum urartu]|uniref:Putative mediator of RNA polymerase II transcription subunit 22 n=1 Tax=Triticum urartu TaxID=4572 RepID=M7ZCC1_TRIUA|nr:Putative mediator of RNA polymerase II transcription subunit 22 [Triticum urartu]
MATGPLPGSPVSRPPHGLPLVVENRLRGVISRRIVRSFMVNDPPVRNSQEAFQMDMRASRMVHSADSLLKLVSELKRTAIFSGLSSLSENVDRRIEVLSQQAEETERMLERIGQEAAASLKELEAHYYSSVVRTPLYD